MGESLTYKIIGAHRAEGTAEPGRPVAIRIDQTLTQDATGTAACLQFEAMGVDHVRTELSVSYVDHNMLQADPLNADDHRYLRSVAARYGIVFSRPGNGICHQVHLERFGVPGKTLLGSDSHTPTGGGLGMIAIGAGGQDVACAMAGLPFELTAPRVVQVVLTGALAPWVSAKDVILELLRRLGVKGGVGKVFEYAGPGVAALSVPERATITNMGAELGATTSVFPSDDVTRAWLRAQGREDDFRALSADPDARYDEVVELDLASLEPLIACPHSPGNVVPVAEAAGTRVQQVLIGSCTNSSYEDLALTAALLAGRRVHADVDLAISPGSRQVLSTIAADGALARMVDAGARILEVACGPCIGMGQAPPSGAVTLRTFNRNFEGRSGTPDARSYLCSPAVAVASALNGCITDPRTLADAPPPIERPAAFARNDAGFIFPPEKGGDVEIVRGPNIKPIPRRGPMPDRLEGVVLLKVGDNVTTDHIMPAGAKVLPLRSNIPAISEFVFERIDPTFPRRAREAGGGFVVAGENYGQGSSREHAALAPMHLGLIAVLARSFSRIHRANLVNFGILPLTFADPADYERVEQGARLAIEDVAAGLEAGRLTVRAGADGPRFEALAELSDREREIVLAGGRLNLLRR
ncbi:MAG: aconitate hydratase [Candidatus Brocadiaceae bacterium]|mgnify:CR=1 FL=1|nr:aconitate hydratase [Candidatus Brocadiaceae bacterium]